MLIKMSGEAAADLALQKNEERAQRYRFQETMKSSISIAASVGKQKSLIRAAVKRTAGIGKQKCLRRKAAQDVALISKKKRHGRNVALHAAGVARQKKRRRSVAQDAAALASARNSINDRCATITKKQISNIQSPKGLLKPSTSMNINRRISEVRNVFNTAVQLKLASDLKAVFGVLDKDHDGTISMEELKKGLSKMRVEMDEVEIKFLWDALNVHHNESISYSDFEHFCHSKSVIAQAALIGDRKRKARDAAVYAAEIATSKQIIVSKTKSPHARGKGCSKIMVKSSKKIVSSTISSEATINSQIGVSFTRKVEFPPKNKTRVSSRAMRSGQIQVEKIMQAQLNHIPDLF